MKVVTDNQRNGELGETLVKAAVLGLGHVFEGRGRLETGIDGTIEFRDPATRKMLGKNGRCTGEDHGSWQVFPRG